MRSISLGCLPPNWQVTRSGTCRYLMEGESKDLLY